MYALKKVRIQGMNEKDKNNALNEIRLLASVCHGNVVEFKEAFLDLKN
jgi:NIMA (never in mitosis gene a)-related kinase